MGKGVVVNKALEEFRERLLQWDEQFRPSSNEGVDRIAIATYAKRALQRRQLVFRLSFSPYSFSIFSFLKWPRLYFNIYT